MELYAPRLKVQPLCADKPYVTFTSAAARGQRPGLLARWPVAIRLLAGSLVALLATGAVGFVSLAVIMGQRTALKNLALLSQTQRLLQDADMEHDAIHADVLATLVDSSLLGHTPDEVQHQLSNDLVAYRRFMTAAQATSTLPSDLRSAIATAGPDIESYLTQAAGVGRLARYDRKAAADVTPAFEEAFDRLAITGERLTNLFASRVDGADAAAEKAVQSGLWIIAIACFGAVFFVGLAGRLVAKSVASALGQVRAAAEAIAAGNLSIRSSIVVNDDIGALAGSVNKMADTLQATIARLQAEQDQDAFSRHLSELLEMADTEGETHGAIARGMTGVAADMAMELLVSDSSRAHLERATEHPTQGAPGCAVESPYGCMAVRRGNPVVFSNSDALNACSKLQHRPSGPVSAVCVPLSFMGRALGVLHATGPADHTPEPRVVSQLTTLGILAGSRIGTVRAFQRTQVQASTDSLTGLMNRRSLEAKVQAFTPGSAYAVILCDLDRFKQLNDKHGHEAGDRALRMFGEVLRTTLRETDRTARWGGEEFVIVLEGRDAKAALEVVERIRVSLAIATSIHGVPSFTASFGLSDTTMSAAFDQLVRIADDALYQSKEGGRDRGTIGDPLRVKASVPRRDAEHPASIDLSALVG